jgi:hypothetical protein
MLFFSADLAEVELLGEQFLTGGIPCEIRTGLAQEGTFPDSSQAELWIEDDEDWYRASLLCVALR